MARIFLSHSSRNNPEAVAIRDWLTAEGWDDLFLDLDPSRGIAAGERWERRLHEAANRCEAVVFLVSRAWLDSDWCLREFRLAQKLNKRIFGLLIEPLPVGDLPAELTANWQFVDLAQGADHRIFRVVLPDGAESHVTLSTSGLLRLRTGLMHAGLDARFFQWPPGDDPDRSPYRGMRPLEAGDAGIFFGREAPTIEALDRLRGLSEAASPRFMVILGASGAGKSSFLRAGLLARLARDDRAFLPLPVVRPERAALTGETGLIRSLDAAARAASLKQTRADVTAAVDSGGGAVTTLLAALAEKVRAPAGANEAQPSPPRIVLAIDQAEELFLAEGAGEAEAFLRLLHDLAADPASNLLVLFTIRSDAYERLQTTPALEGLRQDTLSLPPLPKGAYQTVIEGPAARLAETGRPLKIEPALTAALLRDVEEGGAKDALPLLAFTLERLFLEHGGDGDLRLAEYRQIGGIKGSIDAAVDGALRAADSDPAVPRDRAAREALLRRALIPWLAGIDPETGAPRRRVARLSEIPEEARPLVNHLIAARLLATDRNPDTGETTIEPAHEALLRQWGLLQGWLEEDFAALSALEGVQRAARDWDANARDDAWLAHTAGRLDDAEALLARDDFGRFLDPTDHVYLAAARAADTAHRDHELEEARKLANAERKAASRTRIGLVAAIVLAIAAIGAAAFAFLNAEEAKVKTAEAVRNESISLAALSSKELEDGRFASAVQLALAAWPRPQSIERPQLKLALESLTRALPQLVEGRSLIGHRGGVNSAAFSPDGVKALTAAAADRTARVWDLSTGAEIVQKDMVYTAAFSPDGTRVLGTATNDYTMRIWDAATGADIAVLRGHSGGIDSAVFSPDGMRVVTASNDGTARVWNATSGALIATLRGHASNVNSASFSPDGMLIATASDDSTARVWDAATGTQMATLKRHEGIVNTATFSPDGVRVVTASVDKTARVWDAATGAEIAVLLGHANNVLSAAFSPDGASVVTASTDRTARIWDAATGLSIFVLAAHQYDVTSAVFSPDGTRVATASLDKTARIWDAATGTEVAVLKGHRGVVDSAVFSPDGTRILTASADYTARVWTVGAGVNVAVMNGHDAGINFAAYSLDATRVVTASNDRTARIWDAATGDEIVELNGHQKQLTSAVFSPDATRVVTASLDGTARTWNSKSGATIATLTGHEGPVNSALFSPDGARIVTAADDNTTRIWEAETGSVIAVLRGHEGHVNFVTFSPDGKRVVTVSDDNTARVWDLETGAEAARFEGHSARVNSAVFSPDGSQIVTTSNDKSARIWDTITGVEIAALGVHTGSVNSAAFSPDGTQVVTSSDDGRARIFDAATASELAVLNGHTGTVNRATFSPDGARVVTSSGDGTTRFWDAATGAEVAVLRAHNKGVRSVAFSPDGARVMTASLDGTARIWDVTRIEEGDAFSIACQRLGNNTDLTNVRERYGLGDLTPICGDYPPLPVDWRTLK